MAKKQPNTIASYYKRHIAHIEVINKELWEDLKPVGRAVFYERIKKWWSVMDAITTPKRVFIVPKTSYETPKTIMNPVEWKDFVYVDEDKHSNTVDLVATVIFILWLLYYFQNDIQDYIALLLS